MSVIPIRSTIDLENNNRIINSLLATSSGHLVEYTQYTTALSNKADLINGKVPYTQLPINIDFNNTFLLMGG